MDDRRYTFGTFVLEVVMIALAAVFAFPIYILVVLAFKSQAEWREAPLSPPSDPYLGNFQTAWHDAYLADALISSITVVAGSLVVLVAVGSLAAYFVARCKPRLGYGLYLFFLTGLILPFQLALIPLYQLMRDMGLLGSPLSLILFYSGLQLPFTIFLYAGFIRTIPRTYEEAARIDGASDLVAFVHIILPMLRPITGTVLILNGVFIWNDFMTPLLYLSGSSWATVPVAIYAFVDQYVTQWGIVFAALLIGIAPVMLAFLFLQKNMIKGFASGIKG
ncbi:MULTISPECIES: carbohydrate ABC transporter permease [unclassified Chelatococcus]|uniref:carbohydrate ABC transporter permease n=1 Tax=unclassified Chelatococcus TaxID=2638111 RepID=UPI001BD17AB0|nr:carbohydrate ABC transporter permease [Chelatococcus sp.]MBS7700897.1 carbohydrate ABC transporter permease [Chelatococcus sp. YT9]MBX3555430.1 carbohydrate ABC transporter permease [Chelatococcus sp.]